MSQEKRIEYLIAQNKELVKELSRYDYLLTKTKVTLNKQQKAFKLLIEIQKVIAYSKTNKELFDAVARLINSVFEMAATYIFEPSDHSPDQFRLLSFHDTGQVKEAPTKGKRSINISETLGDEHFILINAETRQSELVDTLKRKFNLSSLIVYPVKYDDNIVLIIVTGIKRIDKVLFLDLTPEDVSIIEAVTILISSYLRKIELIRLYETDQFKTEFVSNISHEFRTPLTLVTGLLEQMKNRLAPTLDSKSLDNFEIITNNAHRIKQLIDQLMDISRIETNTVRLSVKKAGLGDLITKIAKSFFSLAQEKQIDFNFSFSGSYQETWFDEDKLEKILTNLLSNAFKFTGENGKVELSVKVEKNDDRSTAVCIVSDTGRGIPDAEKEKIFERFYQMKHPGNENKEGTGIGLYLAKKLTGLHHGSIEVTSQINQGSKFIVRIPLDRDSFSDDEQSSMPDIPAETDIPKSKADEKEYRRTTPTKDPARPGVLIVEDNHDLNSFIASGLSEDFNIITAFNGKEGLDAAISNIPDLIVTDIMMPEMDGNEMTKHLKKDDKTRHIPVIMLTAKADRASTIEGLECGADDYISKPFNMDELLIKIRNNIETCKRIRDKFREEFLTTPNESDIPSPKDKLVRNVIELMKRNLDEPDFTVNDICRELYISRTQLYRKIEALTGYNPGELLRIIRLKSAAAMFRKGHGNVAQVMYQVGFSNQSNFAKIFKEQFGLSPSSYLRRYQNR